MHFKPLIIFIVIICAVSSGNSRKYPSDKITASTEGDFILVSQPSKFDDEKLRYYPPSPMNKPSSDYSMYHSHHDSHHGPSSLLNLNLNLLEPFMLVTFLLFVLNLLEKAKILHMARKEIEHSSSYHRYAYENPDNYFFMKRNSTV